MKKIFRVFIYTIALIAILALIFLLGIYLQVSHEAKAQIDRGAIDSILFSESPVYYDDQVTPIGVYFEKIHSKYIHYNDIPKLYIKALIASEDHDFFTHPGFDIKGIIRATIANLKAGRIVQGGSTLSQQTAQNVFRREKRGYVSQLKELLKALILEHAFTKEEILEMYVNQFEVTGFGKGLRIASEYFFDKDVNELDLLETAFIAGMVNSPRKYDPFTKKTEEKKKQSIQYAKIRKNSVLKNMRKLGFITNEEYLDAKDREVPFKEGKVTYSLDVILDYIKEQLESDYFKKILHEQGVDNIATSGIRIHTSVSREIQSAAIESVLRNLILLDIKLSGYNKELFQERYLMKNGVIYRDQREAFPFFAEIKDIKRDINNPSITVTWNNGEGVINLQGIRPITEAWLAWKSGNSAQLRNRDILEFLKLFKKGDSIPVFASDDGANNKRLALWEIPELEGSVVVIKNGMIKAMVGGFFNRYFNRASDAKRQLGSIFKPIVYTAALQLKWNNLDQLNNTPDLFKFENTFYIPKPDHEPKSDKVSMTWAGSKSENLATVWLLYHLTDRLNMSEFREIVEKLGLAKKETESYNEYARRIRDRYGVIVNQEALMEAAFEETKKGVESDLIFSGNEAAMDNINRLHFYIKEEDKPEFQDDTAYQILRFDFKRLRGINYNMINKFKNLLQLIEIYNKNGYIPDKIPKDSLDYFFFRNYDGVRRVIYTEEVNKIPYNLQRITLEQLPKIIPMISYGEVWIDDIIPSEVIDILQTNMGRRYRDLLSHNRYDFETLYNVRDFRILVNLLYVTQLAKEMGISTKLDPVLSFPLGANSISILEAALCYNTIISRSFSPLSKDEALSDMVPIITKIVDRDGETIWEYVPQTEKILTERVSGSITEILRIVMENGTGRTANSLVKSSINLGNSSVYIPIPSFGKTGTANQYTNSSFVGIIPVLDQDTGEFDIHEGYVIASYVGYDDNRPMKGRHINIYGSSGALPVWVDTCNAIANSKAYSESIESAEPAFLIESGPLLAGDILEPAQVSPITGIPLISGEDGRFSPDGIKVYSDIVMEDNILTLKRAFEPIKGIYNNENN
jgi:penicillin-binding protein 1A